MRLAAATCSVRGPAFARTEVASPVVSGGRVSEALRTQNEDIPAQYGNRCRRQFLKDRERVRTPPREVTTTLGSVDHRFNQPAGKFRGWIHDHRGMRLTTRPFSGRRERERSDRRGRPLQRRVRRQSTRSMRRRADTGIFALTLLVTESVGRLVAHELQALCSAAFGTRSIVPVLRDAHPKCEGNDDDRRA